MNRSLIERRPVATRVPCGRFRGACRRSKYDSDLHVLRVSEKGDLNWKGERAFVSETFAHKHLGLRASDDRYYEVLYGPVVVGWLDTFQHRFHRTRPRRLSKPAA